MNHHDSIIKSLTSNPQFTCISALALCKSVTSHSHKIMTSEIGIMIHLFYTRQNQSF